MDENDISRTITGGTLFAIPFIIVLLIAYTIISGGSG